MKKIFVIIALYITSCIFHTSFSMEKENKYPYDIETGNPEPEQYQLATATEMHALQPKNNAPPLSEKICTAGYAVGCCVFSGLTSYGISTNILELVDSIPSLHLDNVTLIFGTSLIVYCGFRCLKNSYTKKTITDEHEITL